VLDLLTQRPVELRVCADPLTLRPGRHILVAPAGRLFNPTAAYLGRPPTGSPSPGDTSPSRTSPGDTSPGSPGSGDTGPGGSGAGGGAGSGLVGARPVSWGDTSRTVQVAAGRAAVLVVHENANAGWRATVDGRVLEPVRVDGWQQGFL